jgi:hypothetical protein
MGDTIEELGVRLNPSRLKQQAKDKVRDATIGRVQTMAHTTADKATSAGQRVTSAIRENPIPAALIAAGISWLVVNSRRGSSSSESSPDSRTPSYGSIEEQGINDNLRDKAGAAVESAQGAAKQVKEKAGSVASNIAQTAREKTTTAARTV